MRISGIIAEYNPLHSGHKYQIAATRQAGATHIIAVMSGNYVQRAEPALLTKWARAEMALNSGVDLVIELPTVWATACAERFGDKAVHIMDDLGCVETLSFGCECGDAELLWKTARTISLPQTVVEMKKHLSSGMSFPAARELAVRKITGDKVADVLSGANNTLAVEYIKAIQKKKSPMDIMAIKRKGAGHNDKGEVDGFMSATQIRDAILKDKPYANFISEKNLTILQREIQNQTGPIGYKTFEMAVLAKLRTMQPEDFLNLPDVSEGLENRIYHAIRNSVSLEEVFDMAKTKRYTHSRIRRIILCAFLGITAGDTVSSPSYIRVLGFNEAGREILKIAKKTAKLPIIMRASDISALGGNAQRIFEIECNATDIYTLAMPKRKVCGMEMTQEVIIYK